jgi:hypothetical protein
MEEIEKRLREATDACLAAHTDWAVNKKNGPTREKLMEAVHELRKVAARLEIELAVSERDEMAAKPIPIPPHRASRKRPGDANGDYGPAEDDNAGNMGGSENIQDNGMSRTMRRRRPGGPGGHSGGGGGNPTISRDNMSSGGGNGNGNGGTGNGNGGNGNQGGGRPPE